MAQTHNKEHSKERNKAHWLLSKIHINSTINKARARFKMLGAGRQNNPRWPHNNPSN